MVFRQLQIGLAALALAGSAGGCAQDSSTSAAIEMSIDRQSCLTDVDGLTLTCASTAVVVVLNQSGNVIAGDCATLPAGRLIDSAEAIERTLSLGSLPTDTPLTIELSIHSGVLSTCPKLNATYEAVLFGSTQLVTLNESSAIPLTLQCSDNVVTPGFPGDSGSQACSQCEGDRQFCIASTGTSSCESVILDCESQCSDTPEQQNCIETCDLIGLYCDSSAGQIQCNDNQPLCVDVCQAQTPSDLCKSMCADASFYCSQYVLSRKACDSQYQSCLNSCGNTSSCLAMTF